MKLYFKERIFSWFDTFNIYDENHKRVYVAKGQLSWGHKLVIYDAAGEKVGVVSEKIIKILPKFEIEENGKPLGSIKREISLINPHYEFSKLGWTAKGNFVKWNYKIYDKDKKLVAKIDKKLLRLKDTYEIDVTNDKEALRALMFVLAIDAEKCSQEKKAKTVND